MITLTQEVVITSYSIHYTKLYDSVSDESTAALASVDATPADGKFVVISLDTTDADLKVDGAFLPEVEQKLPVYDTLTSYNFV